ncbi:MAG: hypothetical protein RBR59_09755, partial [Sulfurimonadaceae bacterium]|nr:hypothetical protein [Sulfurimonadaceae bacterium]
MIDIDIIIAFVFMTLLFVRQLTIVKQSNKINYAPLMIGIGAIASVIHFVLYSQTNNLPLLMRDSFLPFLIALIFYLVMNVLHQTQERENAKQKIQVQFDLRREIQQLREYVGEIETKLILSEQDDKAVKGNLREHFKQDVKSIESIMHNQEKFLEKFDELESWHQNTNTSLETFTTVKLPELDSTMHEHIRLLRVAEQEHYNKIIAALQKTTEKKSDFKEEFAIVLRAMEEIKGVSRVIADSIIEHTLRQQAGVSKAFENQMLVLKSHAEGINTTLYEDENRLGVIKNHSEMIMKQIVLSSKKMQELQERSGALDTLYRTMQSLVEDVDAIKADYTKSQVQLDTLVQEIRNSEDEHLLAMKMQVDNLSLTLTRKIEDSLDKLHEHYHIASEDITQSVKVLARKADRKSV